VAEQAAVVIATPWMAAGQVAVVIATPLMAAGQVVDKVKKPLDGLDHHIAEKVG
jgi:hypothetical protein